MNKEELERLAQRGGGDELRCRYSDCAEQHPIATEDERITCRSCREWMGLPSVEEADG